MAESLRCHALAWFSKVSGTAEAGCRLVSNQNTGCYYLNVRNEAISCICRVLRSDPSFFQLGGLSGFAGQTRKARNLKEPGCIFREARKIRERSDSRHSTLQLNVWPGPSLSPVYHSPSVKYVPGEFLSFRRAQPVSILPCPVLRAA